MIRPFDRFSVLLRQRRPRLVEPQKVTNTLFERPPLQAVVCTHIEVSTNGTDWIRPLRTVGVFVGYVIDAKVYGVIITSKGTSDICDEGIVIGKPTGTEVFHYSFNLRTAFIIQRLLT